MASTRAALTRLEDHMAESMGQRTVDHTARLSPAPHPKDASRRPVRGYGQVDVDDVTADPNQPRTEFAADTLESLADSIREKGQLAPIRVRWSDDHQKWMIIAGERRWRASQLAGLGRIDCYFHEGELSSAEVLEQQLIENLLREDLRPIEEARGFAELMEANHWNGKQVAQALRIPASKVSRALALLKLPEDIQQQVDEGEVSARTGYELSKIPEDDDRRQLSQLAAKGQLTHEQASNVVQKQSARRQKSCPNNTKLTFVVENNWKITVSHKSCGNYHEVEQALSEALDEVRHRIQNNVQLY